MPYSSFRQFGEALCKVAGVALPELRTDSTGLVAFNVVIDDVIVNLAQLEVAQNDEAFMLVTFGTAPQDQELEVLRVMGDANFAMMPAGSPVLCRNPDTGEVVVRKSISLSRVEAQGAYDSMAQLVQLARHWRIDPTLEQLEGGNGVLDPQRFA